MAVQVARKINFEFDERTSDRFVEMHQLGYTKEEIFELIPGLKGNDLALKRARELHGISHAMYLQACEARREREAKLLKGEPERPIDPTVVVESIDVRKDWEVSVSVKAKKIPVQRRTISSAIHAGLTFEDMVALVRKVYGMAMDGEPWAIKELMDRVFGKPEKGLMATAVENEVVSRIDVSQLDDRQLRALADVAAQMEGGSSSRALPVPDYAIEEERSAAPDL